MRSWPRGGSPSALADILAERRSVALEQGGERDATARAVLQYQLDELDRELDRELAAQLAVRS